MPQHPAPRPTRFVVDRLSTRRSLCVLLCLLTMLNACAAVAQEPARPTPGAQVPSTSASPAPRAQAPATASSPTPRDQAPAALPGTAPQAQARANVSSPAPRAQARANVSSPAPRAQAPANVSSPAPRAQVPAALPGTAPQAQAPDNSSSPTPREQAPAALPGTAPQAQAPASVSSPAPRAQAPGTLPSPAHVATLLRADGSLVTWYLDRPGAKTYPLVAILQGSECLPVAPKYVELRAALVAHGIGVLRIEKRGLTAETTTCPDEYLRENTIPNRILDCLEVISALRQKPDGWNGRLVIVGGSEGGLVGSLLAPLVPEARALVMLVSGPDSLEEIVPWSMAPQLRAQGASEATIAAELLKVREQFARMTADPSPYKEWCSDGKASRNTWKWWASAARLRPQVALERLDIPVLILQGDDDPITPLRSMQQLDARMRELGKTRFAWRRYPHMQHDLAAPLVTNPVLRDALDFVYRQAGTGHKR